MPHRPLTAIGTCAYNFFSERQAPGDTVRRRGHHGRRATPATVRGAPGGGRTLEAPGGVSPIHPRVPRVPPRDRIALAILRPLRDTVGHALPKLRQPVAPARCACLPTVWRGITTSLDLRPGRRGKTHPAHVRSDVLIS